MFEFDEHSHVKETADLVKENNKMLHKLLRAQRLSQLSSLLRWLIILAISLGVFYYLKPYVEQLTRMYQEVSSNVPSLPALPAVPDIYHWLDF
jgi:hypothetical protein